MPASNPRVLGVLAGEDMPLAQLRAWAESAELIMAADSGADRLLAAGSCAQVLVGDLDSVSPEGRRSAGEVHEIAEQDTTDCEKLLRIAAAKGFESITLISVEGSQPDHELATLFAAARGGLTEQSSVPRSDHPERMRIRIAYRRGIAEFVTPQTPYRSEPHTGRRLSLVPLMDCDGVFLAGVRWPLSDSSLAANGMISISNEVLGGPLSCSLTAGLAWLYVEHGPEPRW